MRAWSLALVGVMACGGTSGAPNDLGVWTPGATPPTNPSAGGAGSTSPSSGSSSPSSGSSASGPGSSPAPSGTAPPSAGTAPPTSAATGVPCDVATVFASKCTACHGDPPVGGALAGLVTYADLTATSLEDPTRNEAQLSLVRMQSTTSPMPPASLNLPASAADVATLSAWVNGGLPAGAACGGDGGVPAEAGPAITVVDVFSGRPAFAARTGPNSHNQGQDCMRCHSSGRSEAPQFLFGGTLYDASGNGLAGAEVRVVDANGTAYSVYTAANGNFYQTGASLPLPAHAGARNASGSSLMISAMTAAGCNSCHCTGAGCVTPRVHLP